MSITKKIKILLIKRDISQKELSARLGTSGGNLGNKLSRDNFSEKELLEIAEALNCDLEISFVLRDSGERI